MKRLDAYWYDDNRVSRLLLPLSWLFCTLVAVRRAGYRFGVLRSFQVPAPVIVVGNITVGGSGKTPLVLWLVRYLKRHGYRPGIASRGHGSTGAGERRLVPVDGDADLFGDEPILLAARAGCPVVVGRDRVAVARHLIETLGCDVVVTDDGLQHYRLRRDIEIAVVDGRRGQGNGRCLPAGPLRERETRLEEVDFRVVNGGGGTADMRLVGTRIRNLATGEEQSIESLRDSRIHAVAGIGDPERFFDSLRRRGLDVQPHPFPDHHRFSPDDMEFGDARPILMTEKDSVKCRSFATPSFWVLPVDADLPDTFGDDVLAKLKGE